MGKKYGIILICCLLTCQVLIGCQPARRPQPSIDRVPEIEQIREDFDEQAVLEHIRQLTSADFAGRAVGTAGEQKAAAYLENQMITLQLKPWHEIGLQDFRQQFIIPTKDVQGHNVLAVLPGTSEQWLLLVAHYDHLGVQDGLLYPGADDNAVAVATLLETARCFSLQKSPPKQNVVFVFTSGEEQNLSGSKALATLIREHDMVNSCRVLNLDMLGGTGGNSLDAWSENSRPRSQSMRLLRQVQGLTKADGLRSHKVRRRFGAVDSRSFASAGIPSITLSWSYQAKYHPHRHKTSDTMDNLKPELAQRAARAILYIAWELANPST